ncbi:GSCOCG00009300001-RA-CDS [Cotesia congregata]|nr:GSCOCG00009300001-RA-CDS [Cotesia congregata]
MTVFVSCFRREAGRILLSLQTFSKNSLNLSIMRHQSSSLVPERVLIVSKVSRYQFERSQEPDIDDREFKSRLLDRGANYDSMLASHEKNKIVEMKLVDTLKKKNNINYQITDRFTIKKADFDWADLVIAIGGDGTFLLGANFIMDNKKPILGINSDPDSSEGYLIKELESGGRKFHQRKLPWLALNEVFIGEALSAKTSLLEIRMDDEENYHKFKSSGICISTGTGSSSWYKAINSLTPQIVKEVLNVATLNNKYTDKEIEKISNDYNNRLQFKSDDTRISYAIRDIILNEIWPLPKTMKPRGFCNRLTIRSHCYDGGLVLDGGIGVPFNIGTIALLETNPDDALRTIKLPN